MSLIVNTKNREDEKLDELENFAFTLILKKNNPNDVLNTNEAKAYYSKLKKRK